MGILPCKRSDTAAALLLLCLFCIPAFLHASEAALSSHAVSIIYIEANTGDSSGGHAALKTGRDVFHFQHGESGLLLLHRDTWNTFRFYYNDLGNRTMYQARLDLPYDAAAKIRTGFIRLLIEQEERLCQLHEYMKDVRLLEAFANGDERSFIKGAGFFFSEDNSGGEALESLKKAINLEFDADFLYSMRCKLIQELSHFPEISPGQAFSLTAYREQLALFTAVSVLEARRGLNPKALVTVPCGQIDNKPCHLSPHETMALKQWSAFFRKSVITLLKSRRPDRGFPLLLATARFLAVERSIKLGKLQVLESFPRYVSTVNPIIQAGRRETLEQLAGAAAKRLEDERKRLFSASHRDESRWCGFENMASRYSELMECAKGKTKMRVYSGIAVPSRPGMVKVPNLPSHCQAEAMLAISKQALSDCITELKQALGYNLFTRNCVTALFSVISDTLSHDQCYGSIPCLSHEEKEVISSISFIPWKMFQQVADKLTSTDIICYPSWRQRQLSAMYQEENPVTVYLRECNTLTSSIYRNGRQDSAFLLFTQEHIAPRPLFGALNIAWSLSRTCAGLFTWPFDSGYLLKSGATGTLFSFPELFFVNIRKGSFSFIPVKEH